MDTSKVERTQAQVYKLHAIQLVSLQTRELFVKVKDDPSAMTWDEGQFRFVVSHSPFDETESTIKVLVAAFIDEDGGLPVELRVEILGVFIVDQENFPISYVTDWAKRNAPLVLLPYLREHVFSLTSRVGINGLIIPLFEVPTFKVQAPASSDN